MIYIIISSILTLINPTGSDTVTKIVLGTTFLINVLISMIMLPINIRLAAQLVMQVFKYRYIVNKVATLDEDNRVMTGYYNHFRAVMCIIVSLVGFNVFNIICSVHFIVSVFKSNWRDVVWSNWIAQGIHSAFQDSVILFAVSMLYQIACYFQGKKFRFLIIVVFTLIRFVYVSFRGCTENIFTQTQNRQDEDLTLSIVYITYSLFLLSAVELVIRFPAVFSFVRVTQRVVNNYIKQFINDINTEYLDREHYVDKIRAGKLLQIAGWGTITVCFLDLLGVIFQYLLLYYCLSINVKVVSLLGISILQVATILPSILYSFFIIILWLYFRYKTRVKYSGYSSYDPIITKLFHEQGKGDVLTNQDAFHYTYYKHKDRIIIITNVVCVILISVIFAAFFASLFSDRWNQVIFMKPGDYYLLNNTELKGGCPIDQLDISVEESQLNYDISKYLNCSENIFAVQLSHPNQIQYRTYNYQQTHRFWVMSEGISNQIWIPANSTYVASTYNSLYCNIPNLLLKTDKLCYISQYFPFVYTSSSSILLGENSCQGVEWLEGKQAAPINCSNFNNNTHCNCAIVDSGIYYSDSHQERMTVHQFGYEANESSLTLFNTVNGEKLKEFDAIIFQSSENISINGYLCRVQATCHFNPALRLLMPVAILLVSMISLTLGIIFIHKI